MLNNWYFCVELTIIVVIQGTTMKVAYAKMKYRIYDVNSR